MTSLGDLKRRFLLTHLYCSRCTRWYSLETVKWNIRGQPRCPTCGTLLRTKTRYYRKFRNRELSKVKLAVIDKFRKTQDIGE
jgi:NAD-dependent SIR2 family protein deacetylase